MKCLLWLLLTLGFIVHPDYHAVPLVVNNNIMTPIIDDQFEDGTKAEIIELAQEDNKNYLIRKGFDQEKNCHISRTEMLFADINGWITYLMPIGGITETCTGVNCSHCGFKDAGGCECKSILGSCNHTISRNRDLLRLF